MYSHVLIPEAGKMIQVSSIAEVTVSEDLIIKLVLRNGEIIENPMQEGSEYLSWLMSDQPPSPKYKTGLKAMTFDRAMAQIRWRVYAYYAGYERKTDAMHLRPWVSDQPKPEYAPPPEETPKSQDPLVSAREAAGDMTADEIRMALTDSFAENHHGRMKNMTQEHSDLLREFYFGKQAKPE